MNSREMLRLLERMTIVKNGKNFTASWKADLKAGKLADPAYFPLLCDLIRDHPGTEEKKLRRNVYAVMGSILRNKMTETNCQYLIDRVGIETDRYLLSAILGQIAELSVPEGVRMDSVIQCSRSGDWLVRHSAVRALQASDSEPCREAARYWTGQTDEKKYQFEMIYANASLHKIGVPEDISLLERHTQSRIRDVRDSALFAIEAIKKKYAAD